MKTYFDTFSNTDTPQNELLPKITLSMEHDVPDELVYRLGYMLMGESNIKYSNLNVLRDIDTNDFYGIVFSKKETNETKTKLVLSVSMLDERLKNKELLSRLFQSMINDFCNSSQSKKTFVQWDEEVYPCNYSNSISFPADKLASILAG